MIGFCLLVGNVLFKLKQPFIISSLFHFNIDWLWVALCCIMITCPITYWRITKHNVGVIVINFAIQLIRICLHSDKILSFYSIFFLSFCWWYIIFLSKRCCLYIKKEFLFFIHSYSTMKQINYLHKILRPPIYTPTCVHRFTYIAITCTWCTPKSKKIKINRTTWFSYKRIECI